MIGRRAALAATLALASVLLAACSSGAAPTPTNANGGAGNNLPIGQNASQAGGGPTSAGQPAANLCSIWTADQVTAVLGGPSGAGVPQNDGQMCLWGDENTGANASISIDNGQGFAATCGAGGVLKVDGIGDGACFLLGGNLGTSLEFEKGGQGYSVAVQKPQVSVDWVETAEKTLALEAISKL